MPDQVIGHRVRQLRGRKSWTAQQLADAMKAVGLSEWSRVAVTKLENWPKYRRSVSVEELLALAYVLDVAPVNLVVPVDAGADNELDLYQVTPDDAFSSWAIREWIRGRKPLPGQNERTYFAEVPLNEMRADDGDG